MLPLKRFFRLPANHLIFRITRRFLPTLFGLAVLGIFFQRYPEVALQFANQASTRLGITTPTITPTPNLPSMINSLRQTHSVPKLSTSTNLDSLSHYIALTYADSSSDDPQIDLKKLAQLADYSYSSIVYLALINPTPDFPPNFDKWLTDNQKDFLKTDYTQLSVSIINATNPTRQIFIVVLAAPASTTTTKSTYTPPTNSPSFNGVELFAAVNKYRLEHGVPQLRQDNTLCTLASIRLNQLLELGRLDNHDGFSPLVDKYRKDGSLTYPDIGENLAVGYSTPTQTVTAWDGSPGHRALLQDGAYVWGCTAANRTFAVLIAAF